MSVSLEYDMAAAVAASDRERATIDVTDHQGRIHSVVFRLDGQGYTINQPYPVKDPELTRKQRRTIEWAFYYALKYAHENTPATLVEPIHDETTANAVAHDLREMDDQRFEALFGQMLEPLIQLEREHPNAKGGLSVGVTLENGRIVETTKLHSILSDQDDAELYRCDCVLSAEVGMEVETLEELREMLIGTHEVNRQLAIDPGAFAEYAVEVELLGKVQIG